MGDQSADAPLCANALAAGTRRTLLHRLLSGRIHLGRQLGGTTMTGEAVPCGLLPDVHF